MVARSQRLEKVKGVRQKAEDQAARVVASAESSLQSQQAKLQQIEHFQREYAAKFNDSCRQGINASLLQNYRAFMRQIDAAVDQQRIQVETAKRQAMQSRSGWLNSRKDTQAVNKLIEKASQQEAKASEKQEQAAMDEHAARMAATELA